LLLLKLERIKDGIAVDDLVKVIKSFSSESADMIKNNDSTAGDIRSGVEILTKASQIISEREEITTEEREVCFSNTPHVYK
jgi:hypothetical protein